MIKLFQGFAKNINDVANSDTISSLRESITNTASTVFQQGVNYLKERHPNFGKRAEGAPKRFVFPESLDGREDLSNKSTGNYNINHPFVKITFYTWQSQNREVVQELSDTGIISNYHTPSLQEQILSEIFLTIPESSIIENFSHQWSDTLDWSIGLNALTASAAGLAVDSLLKSQTLSTISPFLQSAGETAFAAAGVRLNDLHALSYKALDLRSFSYIFNLIPRNARETETIRTLVNHIKDVTTPDYSGTFVEYPAICDVAIYSGFNKLVYRTMLSGVKQFNINYAPAGYMRTFKDGSPIQYTLTLDIQELRRLDKRMIDQRA